MRLKLSIRNARALEGGLPSALVLDSRMLAPRGAVIGRAASADWCLPDPTLHISARHCKIRFVDGRYELIDTSTNGTFVNHQRARLRGPHVLGEGDVLHIGRFDIEAEIEIEQPAPALAAGLPPSDWRVSGSFAANGTARSTDAAWRQFAQSHHVDWSAAGLGAPAPAAPPAAPDNGLTALAIGAGLDPRRLASGETDGLIQAGDLLRRLVSGIALMLEARARAKHELGAQGTDLAPEGNNPLKFARTPEAALEHLLNPPERGFMSGGRAVEDALRDLQTHQMATLLAMQGALQATLDRFSPSAIRARADKGGLLSRILAATREAALWQAYEREFEGVAHDSGEAFIEVFAEEFRRAYEDLSAGR